MELVGIIIAIIAIYAFIKYVVIPVVTFGAKVAGVVLIVILVVSAVYAMIISLISFFKSIGQNKDPYRTYVDNHKNRAPDVKRNYCFGPGFHQIKEIVRDALANIASYRARLTAWKNAHTIENGFWGFLIRVEYGFAVFCTQVLGFLWVSVFSVVMTAVILTGMLVFFVFYTFLWALDRLVLLFKSIHCRCPVDLRKCVIPVFACPTCGTRHKRLVPSPYGVFRRKCSCGTKLATTFLGGRSAYEAHCPYCDSVLYSSSSAQYGLQLVGGIGTGKTSYLAALWHEYRDWLLQEKQMSFTVTPADAFRVLEEWYDFGAAEATTETNSVMYSIIHEVSAKSFVQMTIYDIAGEAFADRGADRAQLQFQYCEGFLLVIDPSSPIENNEGAIINFLNAVNEMNGRHRGRLSSVPTAVIITKSDLYKREIGLPKIQAAYRRSANGAEPQRSFLDCESGVCREFLLNRGYENVVNMIEASFSNIQYFPVSAMGHPLESGEYLPWGVLAPVFWLMHRDNCPLKGLFRK